jgi:gas vesicle protein
MAYQERSSTTVHKGVVQEGSPGVGREEYAGNGRSPAEIEADIARTRAEMDETLAALERKLSPGELVDKALGYMGGPREFYENLGDTVRDYPVPVTLVGIGLAWLMAAQSGHLPAREHAGSGQFKQKFGHAKESMSGYTGQLKEKMHETKESMSGYAGQVKEKVHEAKESMGSYAGQVKGKIGEAGEGLHEKSEQFSGTGERISQYGEKGRERSKEIGSEINRLFHEQPIFTALAGLTLGAAISAIFPATRQERQMVSKMDKSVRSTLEEKKGDFQDAAENILSAGKEAALEEGKKRDIYSEEDRLLH